MGRKSNGIDTIFNTRPTIKEYITLNGSKKESIDFVIKEHLNSNMILRINSFNLKPKKVDLWDLRWSDLIEIREAISEKNISRVIEVIYQVKESKFIELDVFNCFAVYKWINEQLDEISKIEIQELGSDISIEEKEAGIEMLNDFGYTVSLRGLIKVFNTNKEDVLSKPYYEIFKELCLTKTLNEIQKNHIENARRKNKTNS